MERIEIILDAREYAFKMGAEEMVLREPSVAEDFKFESDLSRFKPEKVEDIIDHYHNFLISLGGKKEILIKLALRHLIEIIETLKGKKK